MWKEGDYLTHRFNPGLGRGRVVALEGRVVAVAFEEPGTTLRFARDSTALVPASPDADAGPAGRDADLLTRLAHGDLDPPADFDLRLAALRLLERREALGLGSFLGGRIRLYPHQLYVAERATGQDPVRWLLSDEVGLGKTIEACLILNRLVRTGRVERCLVVAPESLTVQWLGELWRKYHQVFTLLDEERLADVARDFGREFNPFDVHRMAVIALEALVDRPRLTEQAVAAGIDLLVVDEAQRLRRRPGHAGGAAWRAVAPIAARGRHVLLLSATPLEDDAEGFFRLLQLLRPDEWPDSLSIEERLARGEPLPPCTSSTRRADIGGLPPRLPVPVEVDDPAGWRLRLVLERECRRAPGPHALALRRKADRTRRALASGAALAAALGPGEADLRRAAEDADARDPRLAWLAAQARRWKDAGDKTLIFVAHLETLEMVRAALSHRAQLASGVFHEGLSPARRDIEVARFREADGPSLLVSTECGGEGRNFEFCTRLVLFDLPWNPVTVEQRIGRLDRIGRRLPVEVVYFRPPAGIGADVVRLYDAVGLFREPLVGLEPQLAGIEGAVEATALDPAATLTSERIESLLEDADAARSRIREAAHLELHRDRYRASMAEGILARVPRDLDALNEEVVTLGCARLGFGIERHRGRRRYSIEFGNEALVDSLPGVRGGSSFLGTFDREEAVEHETLDFFASGHPLVEGLLADLEESPRGRVGALTLRAPGEAGFALAAFYKDGPGFELTVIDAEGRTRPDWAARLRSSARARPLPERGRDRGAWAEAIRGMGARLDPGRRPHALAALFVEG